MRQEYGMNAPSIQTEHIQEELGGHDPQRDGAPLDRHKLQPTVVLSQARPGYQGELRLNIFKGLGDLRNGLRAYSKSIAPS